MTSGTAQVTPEGWGVLGASHPRQHLLLPSV